MFEYSQQIKYGHYTWSEFKKYLNGTYATLAFQFEEKPDFYKIITEPYAGIHQTYDLQKDSGADQTDFESNFKNLPIRSPGSLDVIKISNTGTAGTPNSNVITIQGISGGTPVPISGSISATNPSVSTVNSTPPSSATYIGGLVNTSAPSYTNNQISALSLTTSGALRVDNSSVTQPITGTVTANAGTGVFDVTPASPVANDYLPVRLTDGSSFYTASGGGGGVSQLKSFTAMSLATVIGSNKSMLSITNAIGSSVIAKIYKIYIINSQTTAVTGVVGNFEIRRCTSHTAGTLITPEQLDTNDTIDSNITIRTGATITGESTNRIWSAKYSTDEFGVGALDSEALDHVYQQLIPLWNADNQVVKPIVLRANQGMTIKFATNSTAGSFDILIIFTQE